MPKTSSSMARSPCPPCPYSKDYIFTAYQHLPDAPPQERLIKTSSKEKQLCYDQDRRLQAVLDFPAWPASTPRNTTVSRTIKVKQVLAGGHQLCTRVLLCGVSDGVQQPIDLVAKIYDPLYYPDPHPTSRPPSVECSTISFTARARRDFNTEASVYRHLEKHRDLVKSFVPKYYGSWIFDLDVPATTPSQTQKRSVCMILIEYINGVSAYQLIRDPFGIKDSLMHELYPKAYVTEVWSQFVEGKVRLEQAGVRNQDPGPRNMIITPTPSNTPPQLSSQGLRVVTIDFGWAEFSKDWVSAKPVNPIDDNWDKLKTRFYTMFPENWWIDEHRHKWLFDHFGGEKIAKEFQPITQMPPASQMPSTHQAPPKTKIPPAQNDQSGRGFQTEKQVKPPNKR